MKRKAALCGFAFFATLFFLCGKDAAQAAAVFFICTAAFLFCFLLSVLLKKKRVCFVPALLLLLTVLLASAAYLCAYEAAYLPASRFAGAQNARICGTIVDCRGFADGQYSYVLSSESINGEEIDCDILVYAYEDLYVSPGNYVVGTASSVAGIEKNSYGKYLCSERLFLRAYDFSALSVSLDLKSSFVITTSAWRQELRSRILRAVGGDEGGLLCGLILGDTSALSLKAENSFTRCGINHIFSVSGFHVSAWSMLPFFLLSLLSVGAVPKALVSSGFVLLVTAVTGFPPSGLRAAIMLLIVYLSTCVRRDNDFLNSLGVSLFIIGLLNPFSGGSLSLLLSASATAGIALFSEWIFPPVLAYLKRKLHRSALRDGIAALLSSILLSLTITGVMAPFLTYYFGSLSLASPLSNLLLAPLTEIAMMAGGLAALFDWRLFLQAAGEICRWLLLGADLVASSPLSTIDSELWHLLPAFLAGGAALLLACRCKKSRYAVTAGVLSFVLVLSSCAFGQYETEKRHPAFTLCESEGVCLLVQYRGQNLLFCSDGAGYEAQTMLTDHHIYTLDALLYQNEDGICTLHENFTPETDLSVGDAVYRTGDLVAVSLPDNAGWQIDVPGRCLVFLFDEKDKQLYLNADDLILPDLTDADFSPPETTRVWIASQGTDTGNLHYVNSQQEMELTGGE